MSARGSTEVVVRLCGPSDAARCARLHASSFERGWTEADFARSLEDGAVCHGIEASGRDELVAFALSRAVLDEADLLTIVVSADARGRGCGRLVLVEHLSGLAAEGIASVHLEVDEANAPALALYRALGFEEIGRRPGYYPRPDGGHATALTMQLRLAAAEQAPVEAMGGGAK